MDHKLHRTCRLAKYVALATALGMLASATATAGVHATQRVLRITLGATTASFIVKVVDPDCRRSGEPVAVTYSSAEEAVKDTIPGEWWPAGGYSAPMAISALKSASIIIRSRIAAASNPARSLLSSTLLSGGMDKPQTYSSFSQPRTAT